MMLEERTGAAHSPDPWSCDMEGYVVSMHAILSSARADPACCIAHCAMVRSVSKLLAACQHGAFCWRGGGTAQSGCMTAAALNLNLKGNAQTHG